MEKTIVSTLLAVLAFTSTASADINNGLQLYLPFNGSFTDASSVLRTVTVNGNAGLCPDRNDNAGNACVLDGTDDYLRVTPAVEGTPNFTMAAWIHIPQLPPAEEDAYALLQSASASFYYDRFTTFFGPSVPPDVSHLSVAMFIDRNGTTAAYWYVLPGNEFLNRWAHVAVVGFADNTAKIYIDGEERSNIPRIFDGGVSGLYSPTAIGATFQEQYGSYSFFNGKTDEVRLYDRALSAADVLELYSFDGHDVDTDGDGLSDVAEALYGTNPNDPDTDDDGLLDGTEVDMADGGGCPNPLVADSDGDTISDGAEVQVRNTNPCSQDTDGDGLPDALDATPTSPGTSLGDLEAATRGLASMLDTLSLSLFTGPNNNANSGRRNSLAGRIRSAANSIAIGQNAAARAHLNGVLLRIDDQEPPEDWISASGEKSLLALFVRIVLGFLS